MAAKLLFTIIACFLLSFTAAQQLQTVNGRISVQIQTAAGCGDTLNFIANDLAATYALYKDFLDIEFVPWGRAVREEDGTLICQFGVRDCFANRLQRCVLELLKGNQDAQIEYMTCEMTTPSPSFNQQSYACAHGKGISLVDVDYCVAHTGEELERRDEIIGAQHIAQLNFVPSFVFNGVFDPELHQQALSRFQNLVCLALAADPTTGVTDCAI